MGDGFSLAAQYNAPPMRIPFSKMQGCGNDFVVIDGRRGPALSGPDLGKRLLDRRYGVGGDQLLILQPSERADVRMDIFERDGRQSEMCGNGIRCLVRFLREQDGSNVDQVSVETLGGKKVVWYESDERIRVDMGPPIFEPKEIPVRSETAIWNFPMNVAGHDLRLFTVSMGNPHTVIFVEKEADLNWVTKIGPSLEVHELFPNRTNVEFVYVRDHNALDVRVWERAAGETAACGTGASAAGVVAIKENRVKSPTTISFRGGNVEIAWQRGEHVFLTGPATEVFTGEVEV